MIVKLATNLSDTGMGHLRNGLLLLLLSQLVVLSLVFIFVALYSRAQSSFVPVRDCPIYIAECEQSSSEMTDFAYVGNELVLFAGATTWKSYVRFRLRSYLSGDILEVGAGIGAATATFYDGTQRRWVCLEPDALADRIKSSLPRN